MSQLRKTVSRCATSLADKQILKAGDILLALPTTEEELFPARSTIERLDHVIHTYDVDDVAAELRNGSNNKVLLTAVGGWAAVDARAISRARAVSASVANRSKQCELLSLGR